MGAKEHVLKCWPNYFDAVESGEKTFEVRKDDRGFQKGDLLVLKRFDPKTNAVWHLEEFPETYRTIVRCISWILTGGQFGIEPGYVVLGLSPLPTKGDKE